MFSGIVEATSSIIRTTPLEGALQIVVKRPTSFDDLRPGDSVAVNGVCLTVESFDPEHIFFTLGRETLSILRWSEITPFLRYPINLERSLRFGDRVHGHLVSGHVHEMAKIVSTVHSGVDWDLTVEVSESTLKYIWKKSGITLNGVSLTINQISGAQVSVHLIPETVSRTNLTAYKVNEFFTVEPDFLAVGLVEGNRS